MARTPHKKNARKQARKFNEVGHAKRLLNAKKAKGLAIPDRVLKRLAALGLPNDPWVYSVVLDALLRGA